ncbi:hypothetical protein [Nocardioides sp.]|uniref:hypothetical protein n=1 Tax=Nocardioides sp. TaxID=35761 RepID=UPI00199ACA57|nr:hypothetical protein [Nocardioides sp.]MBC7275200.1 hypothetical protein [Nocardioides sp.]
MAQTGARAKARAERERLAAAAAEERAAQQARSARRHARKERLTGWIPAHRSRPDSPLAERRRRNVRILVVVLLLLNALIYLITEDVGTVVFAAIASVLVAPVVYTLLFRR